MLLDYLGRPFVAPCVICGRRAGVVPIEWVDEVEHQPQGFACFPCATEEE